MQAPYVIASEHTLVRCCRATTIRPAMKEEKATASHRQRRRVQAPTTHAVDCCEVCLTGRRNGVALVPCGRARFCAT